MLIERRHLASSLLDISRALEEETTLFLVGGAAVLAFVPEALATRDVDVLDREGVERVLALHSSLVARGALRNLSLNTRSDPFEIHLPPDWETRAVRHDTLSTSMLTILTPCPEDLAVMKTFRGEAKDIDDIHSLSQLGDFDLSLYRAGFLEVLPSAIGEPRFHAQTFCLLWNALAPESPLTVEAILSLSTDLSMDG